MTQYYFIQDGARQGPFSKEELSNKRILSNTLVWFHPMKDWIQASDVPELADLLFDPISVGKKRNFDIFHVFIGIAMVIVVIQFWPSSMSKKSEVRPSVSPTIQASNIYREVSSQAFDSEVDFEMYVEKFYRDARVFGIYPIRPKETIIKFAPLDKISGLTHIHGVSFGINNDEKIEIYINPSTWKAFNKPMRYVLMYHELAHDVLNLRDLSKTKSNEEKLLMFPELTDFRSFTMDEFIESYQTVFMEYKSNNP
jgi:hypothetical protein